MHKMFLYYLCTWRQAIFTVVSDSDYNKVDLFVFGWNPVDKLISPILFINLDLKPIPSIVFILACTNLKSSSKHRLEWKLIIT